VNAHGASGAELTTGNARLSKYVVEQASAAGVPVPAIEGFQRAMERAMGGSIANAAKVTENFGARNEAAPASSGQAPPPTEPLQQRPRVQAAATPAAPGDPWPTGVSGVLSRFVACDHGSTNDELVRIKNQVARFLGGMSARICSHRRTSFPARGDFSWTQ
jgi:hypothetical protein